MKKYSKENQKVFPKLGPKNKRSRRGPIPTVQKQTDRIFQSHVHKLSQHSCDCYTDNIIEKNINP